MTTKKIWRLAFAMLAAFSLVSCSSDDDDKDITKEIIMNVSAEPGVMYDLFDSMGEHPSRSRMERCLPRSVSTKKSGRIFT